MADYSDGSMIVDTEIDTEGFLKDSEKLRRAITSLSKQVDTIGQQMKTAIAKNNTAAMEVLNQKFAESQNQAEALRKKMEGFSRTKILSDDYARTTAEIKKTEAELSKLMERQEKMRVLGEQSIEAQKEQLRQQAEAEMQAMDGWEKMAPWSKEMIRAEYMKDLEKEFAKLGKVENTAAFRSVQYDVDKLREKLAQLNSEKEKLESNGQAFTMGTETQEYEQLNQELTQTEQHMEQVEQAKERAFSAPSVSGLPNFLSNVARRALNAAVNLAKMVGNGALSYLRKLAAGAKNAAIQLMKLAGRAISSGIQRIGTLAANAGKSVLGLGKNAKQSSGGLNVGLKALLRYGLGIRSVFALLNKLRSAVREAFENMAKKVPEVNTTLSKLSSSLDRVKNSLATAFQPILTAVAPYLVQFMDMISNALTKVGEFFAALTGQKYVYKATKAQINYAKSLDKTAKSAKEAKNQLADFDKLHILSDSSSDSSDSSKTDTPTSDFEKVPIESDISDFIQRIKNAFKNGDFRGIGEIIADKINEIFTKLDELISWENIGAKITKIVTAITDGINGFVDRLDWEQIGRTIGSGINTIVNTLYLLFTQIDWEKIGKGLARGLNSLVDRVDWEKLGRLFGARLNVLIETIHGFVTNFKWGEAGKSFAEAVEGLVDEVHWDVFRQDILDAINGVLTWLQEFAGSFEWGKHGEDFKNGIMELTEKFPSEDLGATLGTLMGDAFEFLFNVVSDETLWNRLGANFATFLNGIFRQTWVWEYAGKTINSTMKGLLEFGQSFLDTFNAETAASNLKAALKQIQWADIASSTWTLIKTAFKKTGSFLNVLFADESNSHWDPWEKMYIPDPGTSLGERVGKKLRESLSAIPWGDIIEGLKTAASTAFKGIEDFFVGVLGIDANAIDAAGGSKTKAIAGKIGAVLGDAAKELGTYLAGLPWSEIFSAAWETITTTVKNLISGLLGDDSGNGQALLWVAGGIIALKAGLLPLLGKLITGLASGFAAGGPILGYGLAAAFTAATAVGVVEVGKLADELGDAWIEEEAIIGNEMEGGLQRYVSLFTEYGSETANKWAEMCYGIALEGNNLSDNLKAVGEAIATEQHSTFDGIQGDAAMAMAVYKKIYSESGAEVANKWAEDNLYIQLTSKNLQENLESLSTEIIGTGQLTGSNMSQIVEEACADILQEGTTAAQGIETSVTTAAENIESKTSEAAPDIEDNLTTPYSNAVPQVEGDMQAIYDAADNGLDKQYAAIEAGMNENAKLFSEKAQEMVNTTESAWGDMNSTQSEALQGMTGNTESGMSQMTGDVSRGTTDQRQPVYDNWDLIASFIQFTLEGMKTNVLNAMNSMLSSMQSGMSSMESAVTNGMNGVGNSVSNSMSSISSAVSNVDWWSVGDNIVAGIIDGMIDNWKWLKSTANTLANNLLVSTKKALGIASPSRIFRDQVGKNIGLGLAEGVGDTEPKIIKSVTGVADAIAQEINGTDMQFNVGVNSALDTFSDKVADSFSALMDRLESIAESVTFRLPAVATGSVVPYRVSAQSEDSTRAISDALTASTDEQTSAIIQGFNNQTVAIVRALEQYCKTQINLDKRSLTDAVIEEINRRTRMTNKSPLLI